MGLNLVRNAKGGIEGAILDARVPIQKPTGKQIPADMASLDEAGITQREKDLAKRVKQLEAELSELEPSVRIKQAKLAQVAATIDLERASEADAIEAEAVGRSTSVRDLADVRARLSAAKGELSNLEYTVATLEGRLEDKRAEREACRQEHDALMLARKGAVIREYLSQNAADALVAWTQLVGCIEGISALEKQAIGLGLPPVNSMFLNISEVTEILRTAREGGHIDLSHQATQVLS